MLVDGKDPFLALNDEFLREVDLDDTASIDRNLGIKVFGIRKNHPPKGSF